MRKYSYSVLTCGLVFLLGAAATLPAAPRSDDSLTTSFSYSAPSGLSLGSIRNGDMDAFHSDVRYMHRFQAGERYQWGVGFGWERIGFGLPAGLALPNSVHGTSLRFENNWQFADQWSLRINLNPGVYSDMEDVGTRDLNMPMLAALAWAPTEKLMWVAAFNLDPRRDVPVIGGVGVIWKFADSWTLSAVLPKPVVEYQVCPDAALYAGGELVGGAWRVSETLGSRSGRPAVDDQMVSYREIRVGGGLRTKLGERLTASIEGGWVIDRRFIYDRARILLNGEGAAYFGLSLNVRF